MPRETDSEAIAEAARGEIDPELLTGTGSGGFLSTGYFHDGPLIDQLQSDEQLHFVVTNQSKGVTIDRKTETDRLKPDANYRTAAIITDQRTCFVIGQAERDVTVSVPHDQVEGVETATGLLKDKLVIHEQDADYRMYTTKQASTQATADYIEDVAPNAGWKKLKSEQSNPDGTADTETASQDRDYSGVSRSRVPTDNSYSGQSSSDEATTTESADTTADKAASDDTSKIEPQSARSRYLQKQAEERTVTDGEGADSTPPAGETDSHQETDAATDTDATHSSTPGNPETQDRTASGSGTEPEPTLPSPASVATVSEEAATYVTNAQDALTASLQDSSRSAQIRAHTNICAALEILGDATTDVIPQLETAATTLEAELTTPPATDEPQDQKEGSKCSGSTGSQQGESVTQPQTTSADETTTLTTSNEVESSGREQTAETFTHREALLAELKRLDAEWAQDVGKVLMYSVGKFEPGDYVDEFGSWETALQTAFSDETADKSQDGTIQKNTVQSLERTADSTPDQPKRKTADGPEDDNLNSNSSQEERDPTDKEETEVTVSRDQLLAELDRVKEEWDPDPDEILMEVFGNYDPADYENEFGSWDAALHQAERPPDQHTDPSGKDDGKSNSNTRRDKLLAELTRLDQKWAKDVDKVLMYSVSEYDPADYEDEFGSWDAALRQASLRDEDAADGDTTDKQPSETSDTTADNQTTSEEPKADFAPNELAEYYDTIGLLWSILDRLLELDDLRHLNTTQKTLKEWYEAVHEQWSGDGVQNAPSYGVQQYSRNSFTMSDYRDVFGNEDRVTEFHCIDVKPLSPTEQQVLTEQGIINEKEKLKVPVAPKSGERLPLIVNNRKDLQKAKKLLAELPEWPTADEPSESEAAPESDETNLESLPEGRVDELTVTVENVDPDPGDRRSATLTVSLDDESKTTFTSWEKHSVGHEWETQQRYALRKVRHKTWGSGSDRSHELSSTRDTTVESVDPSSPNQSEDSAKSQEDTDDDSEERSDRIDSMLKDMGL